MSYRWRMPEPRRIGGGDEVRDAEFGTMFLPLGATHCSFGGMVKERRDDKMPDAIVGDGEDGDAIALVVIAIVMAALVFGGGVSGGGCSACRVDRSVQATK